MQAVKLSLDPDWKLAPGLLFERAGSRNRTDSPSGSLSA
jgi:hypothetical protein